MSKSGQYLNPVVYQRKRKEYSTLHVHTFTTKPKNQGIPFSSKEAGIFLFWFVGEKSSPLTFDRNVWFGDVTSAAVTSNCFIDFDRVWIEQTQSCVFCPSLCVCFVQSWQFPRQNYAVPSVFHL